MTVFVIRGKPIKNYNFLKWKIDDKKKNLEEYSTSSKVNKEPDNGIEHIVKDLKNCGQRKQCLENFTLHHRTHWIFFFFLFQL